jgi:hypothetical protein
MSGFFGTTYGFAVTVGLSFALVAGIHYYTGADSGPECKDDDSGADSSAQLDCACSEVLRYVSASVSIYEIMSCSW